MDYAKGLRARECSVSIGLFSLPFFFFSISQSRVLFTCSVLFGEISKEGGCYDCLGGRDSSD